VANYLFPQKEVYNAYIIVECDQPVCQGDTFSSQELFVASHRNDIFSIMKLNLICLQFIHLTYALFMVKYT